MTVVRIGQPEQKRRSLLRSRVTPGMAILVIAGIIVLRLWAVETAIVDGDSMETTLSSGDRVLVLKLLRPERFDVVVLRDPEWGGIAIKRVVGLGGDRISMVPYVVAVGDREVAVGSKLYIDGRPYEEPYASSVVPRSLPPAKVPEEAYFVMGDNRDASTDSRRYGPVAGRLIQGVGVAIIFPLSRMRILPRGSAVAAPPARRT